MAKTKKKPEDICFVCSHRRDEHDANGCNHEKCKGKRLGCEEFRTREQANAQTTRDLNKFF